MSLFVHVHGGYPSYEGTGHSWGQSEYDAMKLVQALKGRPINGYATLRKVSGQWVTFTSEKPQPAFDLWGEWAAAKAKQLMPEGGLLVPVPSSDCLKLGGDPKGRALVEAITRFAPEFEIAEALCWGQKFQKSSEGGPRDPDVLFGNIRVSKRFPKKKVILIDDVVTGGGHLIASARAMRWAEHEVPYAICVGYTVHAPPVDGMFSIPAWDIEAIQF